MFSKAFIKGFRYELANREFALRVVTRMAERTSEDGKQAFWITYSELEQFNAMHYRAVAQLWGVDVEPSWITRFRAWAAGGLLILLQGPMMRFVYSETVKYVTVLRNLRKIGPADAALFLNYMVEQEELQIRMMELAFTERYAEVGEMVDMFFLKYSGVLPRVSDMQEFET